jgi:MFS family permease
VAFVLIERSVQAPLMRAATLARRPVISGMFVMLVATGLMLGLFFLSSFYLQQALGFSALETGLTFLPVAIAITLGAQLGAHLIGKIGGRPVAVAAFVLTAVGAVLMTRVSPDVSAYTTLLPGFILAALGIGPAFVTATTTTMANIPPDETGVASGVINTFHELGGSIGVAVVSTVAAAGLASGSASTDGFISGFVLCAIVAGTASLIALRLVPAGKPAKAFVGHGHG